jgi:MFS family permease
MSLLLTRPGFRRLWACGVVSETGDWLLLIALPVYVLQLTGSALTTSTVFLVELAGTLLAGPLAGVLADRWDRRRLLIGASLTQAALLLPLLAVHGTGTLWIVYLVAAAQAVLTTANDPVRQALLPAAVKPDELASGAAQLGIAANLARLVGGALGGVLLQAYGLSGVVLADAATFVLAALLVTGWSVPRVPRTAAPAGARREWLDGLAVIRGDRRLVGGVLVGSLLSVAQGMFVVLFVVFVLQRLGGQAAEVGVLRGVQAVGGIVGGLTIGAVARRLAPRTLVAAGCIGFGTACLAIWNGPTLTTAIPLYLVLFVVVGIPIAAATAGLMSVLLGATPDEFRGRVMSTLLVADAAAQATGTLLAGALVGVVGLLPLLEAHGSLGLAAGVVALAILGGAARRPVTEQDLGDDGAGAVGAAVVADERVVALQPPAVPVGPDRPLDHEQVGSVREPGDDEIPRPDRSSGPDEECVPVPQGRHHRRADHQHPAHGPAE